ncbi:MAG: peptide MFS transporter [Candidatus Krumholzibacteriia bacterium]
MATTTEAKPRHPKGLSVLFFTEMWERFGFYTMLGIFTLYLDEYFHFSNKGEIYGNFLMFVYFTPIFGGMIADRVGFRRTILTGAVLMMIGYAMIAFPIPEEPSNEMVVRQREIAHEQTVTDFERRYEAAQAAAAATGEKFQWTEQRPVYEGPGRTSGRWLFFAALTVLVAGNGLFKPNISVMVGNLYPEGSPLKDSAFNIFYMGINIGAWAAPLTAAWLRNTVGWSWAFGSAALGMLFSIIIFQAFRRHVMQAEIGRGKDSTVQVAEMPREEFRARIGALITIFLIVIVFWMSFHQNGFTMTLLARDNMGSIFGWDIPAEVYAAFNPFFVVALTPLLVLFWAQLRRRGKEPSTPGKMAIGMLLTAAAFFILGVAGLAGANYVKVSPMWLISSYAVVTLGELCLSPMGLSFVSKVAPAKVRGLMMGCWFGATAIGNKLAGAIEPFWDEWLHSTFFFFLVAMCVLMAGVLFIFLGRLKRATAGH